jgi:lipoate-protein ligase A
VKTTWLYSIEPRRLGSENMRRDEAMALACAEDNVPRLRLYSWAPYTLSLGYNQSDDIDRGIISERGYDLVRRPTGGRAVFHADELTYSVAMPSSGAGIHETYAKITDAIRRGLESLGASELAFSRSQPDFREHYAMEESASCFSASALNELTWRGRKLLGSAQRRYGSVLLQHGSLLLGDAHLEIIDLLYPTAAESRRDTLRERLALRTATLRDILRDALPPFNNLATAIVSGFAETFDAAMMHAGEIAMPIPLDAHTVAPHATLSTHD